MKMPVPNTGLAKVAVQCSADTFVVKIGTLAKPETVIGHFKGHKNKKYNYMKLLRIKRYCIHIYNKNFNPKFTSIFDKPSYSSSFNSIIR